MPASDIARIAVETAIAADACGDRETFSVLFETAFLQLRADVHLIVRARASDQGPLMEIGFGRTSPAWEAYHRATHHGAGDPLIRHLLHSTEMLTWSDLDVLGGLSEAEMAIVGAGRAWGFTNALIAPQHQPGGAAAAVLLLGRRLDGRDARRRQAARILCDAYFRAARRLGLLRGRSTGLSPREIEALHHVHFGRSDKAVARAMALSPHTVASYLRSARKKLAVGDRISAARTALELGLVPACLPNHPPEHHRPAPVTRPVPPPLHSLRGLRTSPTSREALDEDASSVTLTTPTTASSLAGEDLGMPGSRLRR